MKVPEETILAWSGIQHSITDQAISGEIVLMRVSKPKENTLNICCDVFVRNCQFVTTFNASITLVFVRKKNIKIERDLTKLLRKL